MKAIRFTHRATLLALVLLGLLFAGCASGGIFGGRDDNTYDPNDDYDRNDDARISEVRGRVDRVDTTDGVIYVEPSGVYRNNLRNDNDQLVLHYDDSTDVEYDGKTYKASALEAGDRIVANVDDTGSRLYARDIEVTYDVTSSDRATSSDRTADDDRYDRNDDYDRSDDDVDRNDDDNVAELRGKVRSIDEDRNTMEIEDATWGFSAARRDRDEDRVTIHYDSDTVVEYKGKRYEPENLERGDEIKVELNDNGSRYMADEITVIASVRD